MGNRSAKLRPGEARYLKTDDYHSEQLVSNSWLRDFEADVDRFADVHVRGYDPDPPSAAKRFGSEAERWVFHGELPDAAVIPAALESRRGPKFREFRLKHVGKRLLTHAEARRMPKYVHYYELTEQLRANALARGMLWGKHTRCHVSIEWVDELTGVHRKCQLDLWEPGQWIADYKTTKDNRRESFARDVCEYGYHWQAATYIDAVELLTGKTLPYYWIAQRNKPSYSVEVYQAEQDVIEQGRLEYRDALERYAACARKNRWLTESHGLAVPIGLPHYIRRAPVVLELRGREIEVF